MSSTYAGNSANDPASITIPSDGDGPGIKAADVNVAFEGLADRTAHLKLLIGALPIRAVLTSAPTSITFSVATSTLISLTVNLLAGEKVVFFHTGQLSILSGSTAGRVKYFLNAVTPQSRFSRYVQPSDAEVECSFACAYTAPSNETLSLLVQTDVLAPGGSFHYVADTMIAAIIRP